MASLIVSSIAGNMSLAQEHSTVESSFRNKTGHFSMRFRNSSEKASYGILIERLFGKAASAKFNSELSKIENANLPKYSFEIQQETYEVYIPTKYTGNESYGLIVYISASNSGKPPNSYLPIFDDNRLIYIAANLSGNIENPIERRIPLALHAVENMREIYNIDENRVYISGFSGGAKVATYLGVGYGDVFNGTLFIAGSKTLSNQQIQIPEAKLKREILENNCFVFLTGKKDFNRREIKTHYYEFRKFGFQNTTLVDSPSMAHKEPSTPVFRRAVKALDNCRLGISQR